MLFTEDLWNVSRMYGFDGFLVSRMMMLLPDIEVTANMFGEKLLNAILVNGSSYSKMISLLFRSLVSNCRTVVSKPTVANSNPFGSKEISKTSLSCVITCLTIFCALISQIVQVVSIDEQQIIWVWTLFQSKLVSGAESSCCKVLFKSTTLYDWSLKWYKRKWSELVAKISSSYADWWAYRRIWMESDHCAWIFLLNLSSLNYMVSIGSDFQNGDAIRTVHHQWTDSHCPTLTISVWKADAVQRETWLVNQIVGPLVIWLWIVSTVNLSAGFGICLAWIHSWDLITKIKAAKLLVSQIVYK